LAQPEAPKRFFWFTYHAASRETHEREDDKRRDAWRSIHQVRDAAAFAEISSVLSEAGVAYGGLLFNMPRGLFKDTEPDPAFTAGDLLLLTTRPPIEEPGKSRADRHQARQLGRGRNIRRSTSALERDVHGALRRLFMECARANVYLKKEVRDALTEKERHWGTVGFRVNKSARYHEGWARDEFGDGPAMKEALGKTAGYVACLPADGALPFSVLSVFGLDGYSTLGLAHALRTSKPHRRDLLEMIRCGRPSLAIAEWTVTEQLARPQSLDLVAAFDPRQTGFRWVVRKAFEFRELGNGKKGSPEAE